jgi:cell fate (sporulation/competence/biofilm development) regulator YlbF (YheA/YmcA/DUF963 family)
MAVDFSMNPAWRGFRGGDSRKMPGGVERRFFEIMRWQVGQGGLNPGTMSLIIGVDDDRAQKADLGDKIRELCEALLEDENVVSARGRVAGFMNNPAATAGYGKLAELSEQLQRKEMAGEPITEEEGQAFEALRKSTLSEPPVQAFMEARGMLQEIESFIMAYVSRTLELGRIPRENELVANQGGGGCGEGCGCH